VAGEVVAPERLIEAVWAGDPPAEPLAALQVHVSGLRRALRTGVEGTGADGGPDPVLTRSGG
jgi:DNA-binding winged helix-turn-helix (wHTH) protein